MATSHVTMLEFRKQAGKVLERVRRGERILLTYRGRAVVRLEPVEPGRVSKEDPFYTLGRLDDRPTRTKPMSNEEIDDIIYGT